MLVKVARRESTPGTTVERVHEQPCLGGMTVNERLVLAGLLSHWDAAIEAGGRETAIGVLQRVEMSEESAAATVDAVLADPPGAGAPSSSDASASRPEQELGVVLDVAPEHQPGLARR